ncbi:glycosyltransferase family 2 protein [Terrarubrum flagellatum]|uniref:glycosyltransferase family 2 protein n=1 Tax=Terrirubrum flagellatum TaxID=2895980 RepID=UPI003144D700
MARRRNGEVDRAVKLTIGIKALNEERHIAASIASAVEAARAFDGEVILADSGSTDRTIEIAKQFPIRIVQLADPSERSCGTGAQLAFQHASGDYFYLLDGDMILNAAFIPAGVAFLEQNPEVAAVGGLVNEKNIAGEEYQIRANTVRTDPNWLPGVVNRLDCGGLYKVSAVRDVHYFADRNLHAFEELELAMRLQEKGWKLARIDVAAVDHFGHSVGGLAMLRRWLRSGYANAAGEVLRGAIGKPHLLLLLRQLAHIRHGAVVILWWIALAACLIFYPLLAIPLALAPLLFLAARRGSLRLGAYSFATWNVLAIGLLRGLRQRRKPPETAIASVELQAPTSRGSSLASSSGS